MTDEAPIGNPFSRVYLRPSKPLEDGKKFRLRIAAAFERLCRDYSHEIATHLQLQYGLKIWPGIGRYQFEKFFETAPIEDILDALTGIYSYFHAAHQMETAKTWQGFVATVFKENSLGYKLDERCGVHRLVDDEFQRNKHATLTGLEVKRYSGARKHFEDGMAALDHAPPNTRLAIRSIFEATEEVFKLSFPKAPKLGSTEIKQHLRSVVSERYSDNPAAQAAKRTLDSFMDWVEGAHWYRHASGSEDPTPPPLDLAIAMISTGTAFLRWLIEIDQSQTTP